MKRYFAFFCLTLGIFFILYTGFLIWERNAPQRLSFANYVARYPDTTVSISAQPETLSIPAVGISLPLIRVDLKNGKWTAPKNGVAYLASSPIPGEQGNSILYGHNWPNLLGELTRVHPGQQIEIHYANGYTKKFTIKYTQVVTPDQTHILNQTTDARVTIYTCIGFLDMKRFVVVAISDEVAKT